jgi:hypothetical protein
MNCIATKGDYIENIASEVIENDPTVFHKVLMLGTQDSGI